MGKKILYLLPAFLMGLLANPTLAQNSWNRASFSDEFGDVSQYGVVSDSVSPVRPMGFPYAGVTARIWVQCNGYPRIAFTQNPNLTGDETQDGYNSIRLAARLDGEERTQLPVTQDWGDNDLQVIRNFWGTFQSWLSRSESIEIVVPWYGEGNVVFKFSAIGYVEAHDSACGNNAN